MEEALKDTRHKVVTATATVHERYYKDRRNPPDIRATTELLYTAETSMESYS